MNIHFFIDIDQTISTGYVGTSVLDSIAYYRTLGVEIPTGLTKYIELFQLPEVVRIHEVFPGAQAGINHLTQLGNVTYATARASNVEEITHEWLRQQEFPLPDQVIFCNGVAEKLLALAPYAGPLVLIDDRWSQLLDVLTQYSGKHRVLRSLHDRLTLIAFGAVQADLPGSSVVPVVPLAQWERITDIFPTT
jgi:hypothetical protein